MHTTAQGLVLMKFALKGARVGFTFEGFALERFAVLGF
jgi:hypothetical protein